MSDGATIQCPACPGRLGFHSVDNLKIGICGGCGGAWFGSGQLDSLVKHGPAALDELLAQDSAGPHTMHAGGNAACPACNLPLQASTYSVGKPLHVSACFQCGGVFLDAASIQALDASAQPRDGASSFGHQGGFGSTPAVPSPQARVNAISNRLFRRQSPGGFAGGYDPVYGYDPGYDPGYVAASRTQNALIVADIAMDVLSFFL